MIPSTTIHPTSPSTHARRQSLFYAALAAALFTIRYGYGYGFSDQDEFLPLISHWLDSGLFANDWFVSLQAESFGIRTIMSRVIWLPSLLFGPKIVVFLLYFTTILASGVAVYRLAEKLSASELGAGLSTILVLSVTTRFNPGGNDIIHSMLVFSSVSWSLGLWALVKLLEGKTLESGVFGALSILAHSLVGLQISAVLACLVIVRYWRQWRQVARWMLPVLLVGVPVVVVFSQLGAAAPESGNLDPTFILTHLRAPHHYLPSTFSAASWIALSALVLPSIMVLSLKMLPKNTASDNTASDNAASDNAAKTEARKTLLLLFAVLVVVLSGAWLLIEHLDIQTVTRLQPFNLTVFLRVLSTIVLACALISIIPNSVRDLGKRIASSRPTQAASVLLLSSFAAYTVLSGSPDTPEKDALHEMYEWVSEETHLDAVFAIPPSLSGFQIGSQRAQFVSFKSFPFTSAPTNEWLRRLQEIAPVSEREPGGVPFQNRLDIAYQAQGPDQWRSVLERENIDFVIRSNDGDARFDATIEPVWCSEYWCVYWAGRILMPR